MFKLDHGFRATFLLCDPSRPGGLAPRRTSPGRRGTGRRMTLPDRPIIDTRAEPAAPCARPPRPALAELTRRTRRRAPPACALLATGGSGTAAAAEAAGDGRDHQHR